MFVAQVLQKTDLSNGGDWEAVSLAFHADLFEGYLISCEDVNGFEDLSVCACAND